MAVIKEMPKLCAELPEPLNLNQELRSLLTEAHNYFLTEIMNAPEFIYKGKVIKWSPTLNKFFLWEECFDHLITKSHSGLRAFSEQRMATLPWLKHILANCVKDDCPYLNVKEEKRDVCILCQKVFYYIILKKEKHKREYTFKTAYPSSVKEIDDFTLGEPKVLTKGR